MGRQFKQLEHVGIRVDTAFKKKLQVKAKRERRTVSGYIKRLCLDAWEK